MFKKRERKGQNQNTRRKREDEDGDNDDVDHDHQSGPEEPNDELQSILAKTKQRRALIHQLQYKRGVDAHELLQHGNKSSSSMDDLKNGDVTTGGATAERIHTNSSTRADALSSKTQLPTGVTIVAEEQRIWDQKHAVAMEEYVQQKLLQSSSASNNTTHATTESEEKFSTDTPPTTRTLATTKEQLYRDLAAQAAKLSGKGTVGSTTTEPIGVQRQDDSSSGDVLTAGAATAIIEVILPIDDRIQVVAATARAASAANTTATSQQSLPYVRNKASAVPNRFRSSYNHHHPMVHQNANMNEGKKRPHDSNDATTTESISEIDKDRPGFAAARQIQQQQHRSFQNSAGGANKNNSNNHHHSRSTDDRVYQQFIKRQREQHGR